MSLSSLSISIGVAAAFGAATAPHSRAGSQEQVEQGRDAERRETIPEVLDLMLEARDMPPCMPGRDELQHDLQEKFASFDWRPVALELRRRAASLQSDTLRGLLLETLERSGTGEEFDLAAELSGAEPSENWLPVLEQTVAGILARDPSSITKLERLIILSEANIAIALASAASRSDAPGAMDMLAGILGRDPLLDLPMLGLIVRAADEVPRPLAPNICETVRGYLSAEDVQLRREAAQAVGKLGDFGSADVLVEMLDTESGSVRAAAHWALREMSDMDFGPDHLRWELWLQTERAWFDAEATSSLDSLNSGRERTLVEALDVLREHHYERFQIASHVSPLLVHNVESVRTRACEVLQELTPERGHPDHEGCPDRASSAPEKVAESESTLQAESP